MILFTIVLRIAGFGIIFFNPLAGMLISFFLDWFDAYLLIQKAGISRKLYHVVDKNVDQVWSVVMLLVGFTTPLRVVLTGLFLFRLLGHLFYLNTRDTRVFIFFPNVFEFAFFWFVALGQPFSFSALTMLFIAKMMQEITLHWVWPNMLRRMKRRKQSYAPWAQKFGWKRIGI